MTAMKPVTRLILSLFASFAFSSCGGEKKEEEPSDGPQSPQGKILKAAEDAMEKANERSERQAENFPGIGDS